MSNQSPLALVDLEQGEFQFGIISETGIVFKDETPSSEWREITERICAGLERSGKAHSHFAMLLGDALRFGEDKYGEEFANAIDATREWMRLQGIQVAKNWQWVAGKIPPHIRRINLSFAHHEIVAKLEQSEQEEFLKLSEDEGLTVRELRDKVRERHPGKPRATKDSVKTVDNEKSALQKLVDVSNFLSEKGAEFLDDYKTADKWKGPMEKLFKMYRRKW
jgi:hypothetical protein